MYFHSFQYLVFFPAVTLVFFVLPKKLRRIWLLICSYYFYMSWNAEYAILIAFSTLATYAGGLLLSKASSERHKKLCLAFVLIVNLLILIVFKYSNFLIESVSGLLSLFHLPQISRRLDLLLPVGISFYTFQALSYTIDVYHGRISAEKNVICYALYVSFFPQLVAGPIERSTSLVPQIRRISEENRFNLNNVTEGLALMCWGFFEKLVIADRISILVNTVYDNYSQYGFFELFLASLLFAFQIYCDFGGYTDIARGSARVLGFTLQKNFRQPYFATSIKDFWRRWHISLTSWFSDYLYIPLGGSRKGLVRKYINYMIVFLVSGLWHGASWSFIVWGGLHGIYRIIGDIRERIAARLASRTDKQNAHVSSSSLSSRLRKSLVVFLLVDFAWIVFAAGSLKTAAGVLASMSSRLIVSGMLALGFSTLDYVILAVALLMLFIVDLMHETGHSLNSFLKRQEHWFLVLVFSILIWAIFMFGVYGENYAATEFIYFQF